MKREQNIRKLNRWNDFKERRSLIIDKYILIKKKQMIIKQLTILIKQTLAVKKAMWNFT